MPRRKRSAEPPTPILLTPDMVVISRAWFEELLARSNGHGDDPASHTGGDIPPEAAVPGDQPALPVVRFGLGPPPGYTREAFEAGEEEQG